LRIAAIRHADDRAPGRF
jgi:signal transduction histidine kinase